MRTAWNANTRPRRIVPATIAALLVTGLGVTLVVVAGTRALDGRWPSWLDGAAATARMLAWSTPLTLAICAGLAVLGLLLLVAGLAPGRRRGLSLTAPADSAAATTTWWLSRTALADLAELRAEQVDGVAAARSRLRRGRVVLRVRPSAAGDRELGPRVRDVVAAHLDALGLDTVRGVRVRVGRYR